MVTNTQTHWVCGLRPSVGILNIGNTAFRKLDLFPFSGEERKEPSLFGSLERAKLDHCTTMSYNNNHAST
jgi:hypothetical protein